MNTFVKRIGTLLFMVLLFCINSHAEIYSGNCGYNDNDSLQWELDTEAKTLKIYCKYPGCYARMSDYKSMFLHGYGEISSAPWGVYFDYIHSVSLSGVSNIGMDAFYLCSGLKSITIPKGVTSIGDFAFYYCSSLSSVTIPESVTSIGNYAFNGCYFSRNKYINKSILISNNNWGATLCDEETSDGLLITNHIVIKCRPWASSIYIPEGVTRIGESAFYGCSGLTSVHINDLASWCNISFGDFFSNPLYYAKHLYMGNQEIKKLLIPEGVTSIGSYAFHGCCGLTSVTLPESVTSIGNAAFSGCSNLTSITIPESLGEIGNYAFYNCHLQNILATCSAPPTLGESAFSEPTLYHANLYVPAGSWDDYAYHDSWYKFINIKEIALSKEQVLTRQPVMLMDTRTFAYSVYDPVNEKIGSINPAGIDENNLYHSWQLIESDGNRFLYNIGAKRFAKRGKIGLEITDIPTPIAVDDGEKGIIFGGQSINQWALVTNRSLIADESIITGIGPLLPQEPSLNLYYNLNGQQTPRTTKGINIIRQSDGTIKKVMIKE